MAKLEPQEALARAEQAATSINDENAAEYVEGAEKDSLCIVDSEVEAFIEQSAEKCLEIPTEDSCPNFR